MFKIFEKIKNIWTKDPFLVFCCLCLIALIGISIYQLITNKKGSWSSYFFIPDSKSSIHKNKENKDSKGEIECRRVLEYIFDMPFQKARPDMLNNPVTGGNHNLELDCYNPELKLAVEFQGQQHYKYTPFFHKNEEAFMNQKYRDELKRRMCKDNMITLIEVPYTVKLENIKDYLLKELMKRGYIAT